MNLNLSGHHVEISPALREYVTNKAERIERHVDHVINADVVLTVEGDIHQADATLHISGTNLHATATHGDMYAAIDGLISKLDEQARRHRERRRDQNVRQGAKRNAASGDVA